MIVLFLLLLLLTPAWSFAQDAEEPSLAEVARRERERRASMKQPARIITNANLKGIKGVSNGTAPSSVETEGENDEGAVPLLTRKATNVTATITPTPGMVYSQPADTGLTPWQTQSHGSTRT